MRFPMGCIEPAVVGWCVPGYPAEQAGLKEGDQILQIGDTQNPTWQDVHNKILISPNQPLAMRVKRGNQVLPITLVPKADGKQQTGEAGWLPRQPFLVTALEPDMPGVRAGLQVGDEILAVDGTPIRATGAMQAYLQTTKDKPVHLEVLRHNQPVSLTDHAEADSGGCADARAIASALSPSPRRWKNCRCSDALSRSVDECKKALRTDL